MTTRRRKNFDKRTIATPVVCAFCRSDFTIPYRISATRKAKNHFCSKECRSRFDAEGRKAREMDRFMSHVDIGDPTACWEWNGRRDPNGYGRFDMFSNEHGRGVPMMAHRVAYKMLVCDIPDKMFVLHKCDNPPCCNPAHHFLGTQTDNVMDMISKGRQAKPKVRRGLENNMCKLNKEQVAEIVASGESNKEIAKRMGVTAAAVYNIRNGLNWSWFTGIKPLGEGNAKAP